MKPLLYRPTPKWPLVFAFTAAAAIHLSALAFSPAHRNAAEPDGGAFPTIDVDPEPAELPSEQPQIETPPIQQPFELSDFTESQEQTFHPRRRALKVISRNQQATASLINAKLFTVSAPRPEYPYQARRDHITGGGAVILEVDPLTGSVINARMIESTGSSILDNSAISAFRRWRFKNGTPSPVKVPFTFTMSGAQF